VKRRWIPLAVAVALGVSAAPASAEPTASFAGGTLTVVVSVAGDEARIGRAGTNIVLNGPITGGTPTTASTTEIVVSVTTPAGARVVLDLSDGALRDGADDPIDVDGNAGIDELRIQGGDAGVAITCGNLGCNLDGGPNPDVVVSQFEVAAVDGGPGNDIFKATGGDGTGSYFSLPVLLTGGGGNDTLTGAGASDTLQGGEGDDTLTGNTGDDVLLGGAGTDSLDGGLLNDGLDGGAGNDTVRGGDGSDVLENSPGDDLLDGGAQNPVGEGDRVSHGAMAAAGTLAGGVTLDLAAAGPQATGGAGTDTLMSIEAVGGTPFDDVLRGTDANNRLTGGDGNDLIEGRALQDRIDGGNGNDTLLLGPNEDTASGGSGADRIDSVDGGFDTVDCGAEVDAITADAGDSITGCEGPPGGLPGNVGPPLDPGGAPVRVTISLAASVKVRRGAIALKVGCPTTAVGSCEGTARLRAKVGKRTSELGARAFSLQPGRQGTVRIKLNRRGRALVRSKRRLKATVRITVRDDVRAGTTLNRKVTLKR
jgi:Ca2+-binding RTX toxin-like protein